MGLPAYAETCPQYLFLSYDNYEEPGFEGAKYVMSPPLRAKRHQDAIWNALASRTVTPLPPIMRPSTSKARRKWAARISPRSPTASPASRTA
jgi:dihydropyrimidinase